MFAQLSSTWHLTGINSVSWLGKTTLLAASREKVFWFRLENSRLEELRVLTHGSCSGRLYSLPEQNKALVQMCHGPWDYSIQIVDEHGLKGRPVPIPFYGFDQITADSSGSLLAAYGTVLTPGRAGYIEPVESCLIDMVSGTVERLPYSAVTVKTNSLYFAKDRTVYTTNLVLKRNRWHEDKTFVDGPLAVVCSDRVLAIIAREAHVWVATECGVFIGSSSGIDIVHKWEHASRVVVVGEVLFASDVGPEVQVYDAKRDRAWFVSASSGGQVTGFDALCTFQSSDLEEGLLIIASQNGVLDLFSWRSSSGN